MRWPQAGWTALIGLGIGAAIGMGASFLQSTTYAAETRVLIRTPETERLFAPTGDDLPQSRSTAAELAFARGDDVSTAALQGESIDDVSVTVNVSTEFGPDDAGVLVFRASASTAELAVRGADAFADAYILVRQQRDVSQATERRDSLAVEIVELDTRLISTDDQTERAVLLERRAHVIDNVDTLSASIVLIAKDGANAFIVQRASIPNHSLQASLAQTILVGAVLGLLVALCLRSWFAGSNGSTG